MALALIAILPSTADAICPSKCTCDDEVLRASCESTGLEVVPIQLNPEVRAINLRGNRISSMLMSFSFYMNLRSLDVSRNRVTSLGARVFEFQEKLEILNISGNEIATVSKDAFRGLRSLRVLDLSENMLKEWPATALTDTIDLAELYLTSNQLMAFADRTFERLGQLRVLRLDDNLISEVPTGALRRLPALKQLGLNNNLVQTLADESLPALRDLRALHLRDNELAFVHRAAFDGLPALQFLDLSNNNLSSVPTAPLAKLSRLIELHLSGNKLSALEPVAFQSLFELRRLRLSQLPQLQRVDARALADNVRLESVHMDDTGLRALPQKLFHDKRSLIDISVRGNSFTSLDASQFPLDQLHALALGGNPLHCNCSLLWLWLLTRRQMELEARNATAVVAAAAATVASSTAGAEGEGGGAEGGGGGSGGGGATPHLDIDVIRCAEPQELRNTLVADAPEAAVRCDASWLSVIIVAIVVLALFAGTCGLLLLVGSGRWCHRPGDDEAEASAALPAAAHGHLQNGTVLMLVTSKENADPMDGVVLRHTKDPAPPPPVSFMAHHRLPPDAWDAPRKEGTPPLDDPLAPTLAQLAPGRPEPPPYHLNGHAAPAGVGAPRKPAHIVYV